MITGFGTSIDIEGGRLWAGNNATRGVTVGFTLLLAVNEAS
jgi:hypothetical protein